MCYTCFNCGACGKEVMNFAAKCTCCGAELPKGELRCKQCGLLLTQPPGTPMMANDCSGNRPKKA